MIDKTASAMSIHLSFFIFNPIFIYFISDFRQRSSTYQSLHYNGKIRLHILRGHLSKKLNTTNACSPYKGSVKLMIDIIEYC